MFELLSLKLKRSTSSKKTFEIVEISSEIITEDEKPSKENIFGLTKPNNLPEKMISMETKRIFIKYPYINLKAFRIEEFINYFENLYKDENIIGQKHFNLIIKLIIESLPNVKLILYLIQFFFRFFKS